MNRQVLSLAIITSCLLSVTSNATEKKAYFNARKLLSSPKHCPKEIHRATYYPVSGSKATNRVLVDFRCPRELKIDWNLDHTFVFITNGSEAFVIHQPEKGTVGKNSIVEHYLRPKERWLGPWLSLFLPLEKIADEENAQAEELLEGYSINFAEVDATHTIELLPKEISLPRIKIKLKDNDQMPSEVSMDINKKTYDLVRSKIEPIPEEGVRHFLPDLSTAQKTIVFK